ncbi:MAG: DUF456 domain-containing protein [Bacteroidales bacterium]|nr:DUF456 domain-containing protein [Bacteroidales bacterium]MBR1782415.1 DUF456 domain-containing protein [Bacteroidales bacterium]
METFVAVAAIILGVLGIIGSVAPALPGPPLSWVGLLCLYIWGGGTNGAGEPMSTTFLLVWLGIVIAVSILDYFVPAWFTKVTGGSKYGGWGAVIGLFIGLIYPPVGMILGSVAGAFVAELLFARKDTMTSVKSAIGAFLGFMFGTGIKLISSAVMLFYIIIYAF